MRSIVRSILLILASTTLVFVPLIAVNAEIADRQTGADMCQFMPPGGTHFATTDTYCQHQYPDSSGGFLNAMIWFLGDTSDQCPRVKDDMDFFQGEVASLALGDCGYTVIFAGASSTYFVIHADTGFYQVAVDAAGENQAALDRAIALTEQIESLIRAAANPPAQPAAPQPGSGQPSGTGQTGLPICAEAAALLEGFGAERLRAGGISDPLESSIKVDDEFLVFDFQAAVRNYNERNAGDPAYVSDSLEQVSTLVWMFSNGGLLPEAVSREFITGHEASLITAIRARTSEKESRGAAEPRLSPGEVFELALELTGGDANSAMLTAHNAIRTVARGDGTGGLMGVTGPAPDFLNENLIELRGHADNAGPWYHLFGTGYMEIVSQGDWSPYMAATAAVATGLVNPPAGLVMVGAGVLWQAEVNKEGSLASRFYNALEQIYREQLSGRTPDPEKFCFNVWGSQIGNMLYENLPYQSTRGFGSEPFSDFTRPDLESPSFDAIRDVARARFMHVVQSPFSVQWQQGSYAMVLDQADSLEEARLLGSLPALFFPVAEEDTWGAIWFSAPGEQQVTFESMLPATTLHYTRMDLETGEIARYETVVEGEGARVELLGAGGASAPTMIDEDGRTVEPQIQSVQQDGLAPDFPERSMIYILIVCIFVGLCIVGAAVTVAVVYFTRRKNEA
ncbi:MAG: hypothetical protein P1P76_10870 [Anaerolineales bacterium]|nr:hypothetical protein [Anaerolineales bacterium]